jgi:hypothetical protein
VQKAPRILKKEALNLPSKGHGMWKDTPDPRFWTGNLLLPTEK